MCLHGIHTIIRLLLKCTCLPPQCQRLSLSLPCDLCDSLSLTKLTHNVRLRDPIQERRPSGSDKATPPFLRHHHHHHHQRRHQWTLLPRHRAPLTFHQRPPPLDSVRNPYVIAQWALRPATPHRVRPLGPGQAHSPQRPPPPPQSR